MKKLVSMILILAFAFTLAACNVPAQPAGIRVDIFIYDFTDPYITSVRTLLDTKLKETPQITATFYDGMNDQMTQSAQIEDAINAGTDLLIVNIVSTGSEEAAMTVIDLAKQKEIPIIFFNREVSSAIVSSYEQCAFVGTNPDEAGYLQGQLIFDILNNNYDAYDLNGDGEISYIMFKGDLANAEANGRTKYSVEEANRLLANAGFPALKYYDPDNTDLFAGCDWNTERAKSVMQAALKDFLFVGKNPIEFVISNNDAMALGAIEALQEVGYNYGDGPFIPVVGVDATAAAVTAIDAKQMSGTIEQDADGMSSALVFLVTNVLNGNPPMQDAESVYRIDSDAAKIRIPYKIYY